MKKKPVRFWSKNLKEKHANKIFKKTQIKVSESRCKEKGWNFNKTHEENKIQKLKGKNRGRKKGGKLKKENIPFVSAFDV